MNNSTSAKIYQVRRKSVSISHTSAHDYLC